MLNLVQYRNALYSPIKATLRRACYVPFHWKSSNSNNSRDIFKGSTFSFIFLHFSLHQTTVCKFCHGFLSLCHRPLLKRSCSCINSNRSKNQGPDGKQSFKLCVFWLRTVTKCIICINVSFLSKHNLWSSKNGNAENLYPLFNSISKISFVFTIEATYMNNFYKIHSQNVIFPLNGLQMCCKSASI